MPQGRRSRLSLTKGRLGESFLGGSHRCFSYAITFAKFVGLHDFFFSQKTTSVPSVEFWVQGDILQEGKRPRRNRAGQPGGLGEQV